MTLRRWSIVGISSLALLAFSPFLLTSCSTQKPEVAKAAPRAAVPVTVAQAKKRDMPVELTAIGNVSPVQTVQVKSMVTAEILEVHFAVGQDVKKGQLLFTLDPRSFEADLARAQGQLAKDQAAAANAHTDQKRYNSLLKEGVVAQQQYDAMDSSAAQYDAAVQADKAAVESARVNLQYAKIYSPITGRAGDILVHAGNLIKANDAAMVVINQITPIYADFAVPEKNLGEIRKYMASGTLKVVAMLPETSTPLAEGKVAFVDNSVDRATGTITLKAEFANLQRNLWPGQFVNINLQLTTEKNATVVPTQAVQNGQQGPYVFVVKSDKSVEARSVDLGPSDKAEVVIRKGVEAGETVVTDGQVRIVPGSRVEWNTSTSSAGIEGKQS
ncbi:MAG TPA: efflux RND transporter periplasmic adaptor subunit [Terriglobales bacterium]|nr:efflux RND transporter periplasmic adaptor subunit [Terriglobales bacterium]